jgi:hypothetical protein
MGHERRFRYVRDESGLPPTPERLRQRTEPTLRAKKRHVAHNGRRRMSTAEGAPGTRRQFQFPDERRICL